MHTEFDAFTLTDWMPYGDNELQGICRLTSRSLVQIEHRIKLRDRNGLDRVEVKMRDDGSALVIGDRQVYTLLASHPIRIEEETLYIKIPPQQEGWVHFSSSKEKRPVVGTELIRKSLANTRQAWEDKLSMVDYRGVYQEQVVNSCRAICLMTHVPSGGIVAAATTSLPEGYGNGRNYDYRFVWLRDSAMIVSAHIRAIGMTGDAVAFLQFLQQAKERNREKRFVPFYDLEMGVAPSVAELPLRGYKGEQPVVIGNKANHQLQLDANANVLLAAKLIYGKKDGKPHWDMVEKIADFVAENWHKKDHGIWEEPPSSILLPAR